MLKLLTCVWNNLDNETISLQELHNFKIKVVLAKPSESGNGCNSVIGAGDNSDCVGDRDGLNHSQG